MSFYIVTISQVSLLDEEMVTHLAFEHGASGVQENLNFNKRVYPKPEIIEASHKTLLCYFEYDPHDFVHQIETQHPHLGVLTSQEENRDWLEEWKKGFKSFPLVEDIWIVPSWEREKSSHLNAIYIEPGMAFGTGTHETTQLCSEILYKVLKTVPVQSVLDVGTGTGILSILAHKFQIPKILATDNDPEAIRVAQENFQINDCSIEAQLRPLSKIPEIFDVVVANIIDGVLLELKSELLEKTQDHMIVSGILIDNDSEFISEFLKDSSLEVIQRLQKGEWVSYWMRKKNATLLGS